MNMLKLATLTTAFVGASAVVQAQTANISTTALETSGTAVSTALQSVSSPTYFLNDGQTVLMIRAASGSTVRIKTQAQSISQAGYGSAPLSDQVITAVSGSTYVVGPFPVGRWNDPTTGLVRVEFSSITGISATAKTLAQ